MIDAIEMLKTMMVKCPKDGMALTKDLEERFYERVYCTKCLAAYTLVED